MFTLATFSSLAEADMAKARLESAGIRSFIPEEASAGWMLEGAAPMVIGVRIQVADEDAARAHEVLASEPTRPIT